MSVSRPDSDNEPGLYLGVFEVSCFGALDAQVPRSEINASERMHICKLWHYLFLFRVVRILGSLRMSELSELFLSFSRLRFSLFFLFLPLPFYLRGANWNWQKIVPSSLEAESKVGRTPAHDAAGCSLSKPPNYSSTCSVECNCTSRFVTLGFPKTKRFETPCEMTWPCLTSNA